jgi:hypothetical protein
MLAEICGLLKVDFGLVFTAINFYSLGKMELVSLGWILVFTNSRDYCANTTVFG